MSAPARIPANELFAHKPSLQGLFEGFMAAKAMARTYSDAALFAVSNGADPMLSDSAFSEHNDRARAIAKDFFAQVEARTGITEAMFAEMVL